MQRRAGGKNDHRGQQTGQKLPGHENLPPHRRQQIEVQALIQHLPPEQVHEDAHAPEKDGQPQVKELEYRGENHGIFLEIAAILFIDALQNTVHEGKRKIVLAIRVPINFELRTLAASAEVEFDIGIRLAELRGHIFLRGPDGDGSQRLG